MNNTPSPTDLALRRFGPAFPRKCRNPSTIECARLPCQQADACQHRAPAPADGQQTGNTP